MPQVPSPSSRRDVLVAATIAVVAAIFAMLSPGGEFFQAYTWLVLSPEKLLPALGIPSTYNPAWLIALMAPFVILPGRIGLVLFLLASIAMCLVAAHVLGGKTIPMLISAQMAWILWWGQIEGLVVLGVALGWLALERKSWRLMVLAMALATLKPQIGLVPIIALWWWSGTWIRWRSLVAYCGFVAISIVIWGPWPIWFMQGIGIIVHGTQYGAWNSSLGLLALPLFVPALLLPLDRRQRLLALAATATVCSPYMPYYSTILLLCMGIPGWAYVFAFLGYLPTLFGTFIAWNGISLLPLSVLCWLYWPALQGRLGHWPAKKDPGGAQTPVAAVTINRRAPPPAARMGG